ncbi:hypothetical protein GCM10028820_22470 [Tessaracoccus terricola]
MTFAVKRERITASAVQALADWLMMGSQQAPKVSPPHGQGASLAGDGMSEMMAHLTPASG